MNEPTNPKEPIVPASEDGADVAPLPVEDIERVGVGHGARDVADERPRREMPPLDHSDRAGGDDQEIDTAGQIPSTRVGGDIERDGL